MIRDDLVARLRSVPQDSNSLCVFRMDGSRVDDLLQTELAFWAVFIDRCDLVAALVRRGAEPEEAERAATLIHLRYEQRRRSYQEGWVWHKYKETFGEAPPDGWRELVDDIVSLLGGTP